MAVQRFGQCRPVGCAPEAAHREPGVDRLAVLEHDRERVGRRAGVDRVDADGAVVGAREVELAVRRTGDVVDAKGSERACRLGLRSFPAHAAVRAAIEAEAGRGRAATDPRRHRVGVVVQRIGAVTDARVGRERPAGGQLRSRLADASGCARSASAASARCASGSRTACFACGAARSGARPAARAARVAARRLFERLRCARERPARQAHHDEKASFHGLGPFRSRAHRKRRASRNHGRIAVHTPKPWRAWVTAGSAPCRFGKQSARGRSGRQGEP